MGAAERERGAVATASFADLGHGLTQAHRVDQYLSNASRALTDLHKITGSIAATIEGLWQSVASGGTIFWCGNGGSAAEAQHLAAELMGRFRIDREPIPSLALTTDTSVLTAVGNDFGFQHVFERQVQAMLGPSDALVALSTSGNSQNVSRALAVARGRGIFTVALTGNAESECSKYATITLRVPSGETSHIQEAHLVLGHLLCDSIEQRWSQARQ